MASNNSSVAASSKSNMFGNMIERLKNTMIPQQIEDARVSFGGQLVFKTNTPDGKQWVDQNAVIYEEALLIPDVPVFAIKVAKNTLTVGDIVKLTSSSYGVVDSINGDRVDVVCFGGDKRRLKDFKDQFIGAAYATKVVNPFGSIMGQNGANAQGMQAILPLMMLSKKDGSKDDFMSLIMVSSMLGQNGGTGLASLGSNPMLMLALMKDGGDGNITDLMTTMMLTQSLGNANATSPLANLFGGTPAVQTPAPSKLDTLEAQVKGLTEVVAKLSEALNK